MTYLSSERLNAVERGEAEIEKVVVEAFEEADAKVRVVPTPEVHSLPLHAGDLVLLCSDGLWETLSNEEVNTILGWQGSCGSGRSSYRKKSFAPFVTQFAESYT